LPVATNPEQVKAITTGGAKSTKDPSYPKGTRRAPTELAIAEEENNNKVEEVLPSEPQEWEMRQDFYDTTYLPFPHRNRRPQSDEQFGKIVEVIQKLYVNIPLLDAIQVPTYAKYIKDILNKKRPLPTTEVIKLTEECSAAILNKSPEKKKDLGCPTIDCSIRDQHFNNALCDLGASVSVMPTTIFYKLKILALEPTSMC
jgi:hypothetical protein